MCLIAPGTVIRVTSGGKALIGKNVIVAHNASPYDISFSFLSDAAE